MKNLVKAVMLTAALAVSGCATMGDRGEVALRPMQRTPAAQGSIALSSDKNGNTVAELKMKHLPPPALLSPELATYVVWGRASGQADYQNLGQVRLDADREASTFVRVPYTSFDLLITAEPVPGAIEPSEYQVLRGSVGGAPMRDDTGSSPNPGDEAPPSEVPLTEP